MKKILLLMATHMVCLFMCAQSQLVVTATNGSQTKIGLDKKPVVTFGLYGDKVKISYGSTVKELDVKDLTFEGVNADSKEMVIINGELIPLASIKSILQKSYGENANHLANIIAQDPKVSIYYAALKATHMVDTLKHYMDLSYTWSNDQNRIDSCTWSNSHLCIPIAKGLDGSGGEYDNVAYPEKRYFNFTAFLVPDSILEDYYGITSLDDLRQIAHELYDVMYPEDSNVTDETDRRNALNRFVSYHVLPIWGEYYGLTAIDNGLLSNNFYRLKNDVADWYETLMPHSIMKFSFPSGPQTGLYVNRRGIRHHSDDYGSYVTGSKVTPPNIMDQVPHTAVNGIYHYIDDIIAYDRTMQEVVCYDRIRIDATTLSPDFMTKLTDGEIARGHTWGNGRKYDRAYNSTYPNSNPSRCVGFKPGYARNFEYNNDTHMHVRNRSLYFWSYQGDEVILKGKYDATIKLPSLPPGKYELRLGTCMGFETRGLANFYIDGVLVDENVDFRQNPSIPASPYSYQSEKIVVDGKDVIHYYPQWGIGWLSDAELENLQNNYWEDNMRSYEEDGVMVEVKDGLKLKEDVDADEAYNTFLNMIMVPNRFATVHQCWENAQQSPEAYIFDGDEPLDPNSEEMQAYYAQVVDREALIKYGPVKYFDIMLHEKGWMKGVGEYYSGEHTYFSSTGQSMRDVSNNLRRVIGTFSTDGKTDHYLRVKQQLDSSYYELAFDFIELIPIDKVESENIY